MVFETSRKTCHFSINMILVSYSLCTLTLKPGSSKVSACDASAVKYVVISFRLMLCVLRFCLDQSLRGDQKFELTTLLDLSSRVSRVGPPRMLNGVSLLGNSCFKGKDGKDVYVISSKSSLWAIEHVSMSTAKPNICRSNAMPCIWWNKFGVVYYEL